MTGGTGGVPRGVGGSTGGAPSEQAQLIAYSCDGSVWHGVDADGDGAIASGLKTPAECVVKDRLFEPLPPPDCDDSDTSLYGIGFADADGDGYGNFDAVVCFGAELPEGASLNGTDCDDADASAYQVLLEDQDRDGFGAAETCAGTLASGLVALGKHAGRDCDDASASVHPLGWDYPGDGLDTNCDEVDGEAEPEELQPQVYDYESVQSILGGSCSSAEIPIEVTFGWGDIACLEVDGLAPSAIEWLRAIARFRNVGTEATPATVFVGTSELSVEWRLELPVPALMSGETTARYALGEIPAVVAFHFEDGDGQLCTAPSFETQSAGYCFTK
jgi:hypothetical protein